MLTPKYLQRIIESTERRTSQLNSYLTSKIVDRILTLFENTGEINVNQASVHDAMKQEAAGKLFDEVQEEIIRQLPNIQNEVRVAFMDAAGKINRDVYNFTKHVIDVEHEKGEMLDVEIPDLPDATDFEKVGIPKSAKELNLTLKEIRMLESAYNRTNGEIYNITQTTAAATEQTFIDACDSAYWKVSNGVSPSTAITEAIEEVSAKGITTVHYGRRDDKIEVAIARAVRTGINQANGDIKLTRCAEMGVCHVRVNSHIGARVTKYEDYTNHSLWQGKVYKLDWSNPALSKYQPTKQEINENKKSFNFLNAIKQFFLRKTTQEEYEDFITVCGYGKMLGICGINCRHSFDAFYPDVNINTDKPIDPEKNRKQYELEQKQRAKEREIRELKRRKYAFDNAKPSDKQTKEAIEAKRKELKEKLEQKRVEYKDFCRENRLSTENYRLQIAKKYGIANDEGVREYLKIFNCNDEAVRDRINMEYDMIPQKHRELLERNGIAIIVGDESKYDYFNHVVHIDSRMECGELLHECGHAIEDSLGLEYDEKYNTLLQNIMMDHNIRDVVQTAPNEYSGKRIWLLKDNRFVSEYQGRMYEEAGIMNDNWELNQNALWEYFSEGYKVYILDPDLLKEKDVNLYNYIKELVG